MAIEKPKRHKSTGIDQIPAGVGQFVLRSINLLILFGIRSNSRRTGRSRLLYLFMRRAIKQIAVIIGTYLYYFCELHTKFYPTSCCQG